MVIEMHEKDIFKHLHPFPADLVKRMVEKDGDSIVLPPQYYPDCLDRLPEYARYCAVTSAGPVTLATSLDGKVREARFGLGNIRLGPDRTGRVVFKLDNYLGIHESCSTESEDKWLLLGPEEKKHRHFKSVAELQAAYPGIVFPSPPDYFLSRI